MLSKNLKAYLILFFATLLLFARTIINPSILLARNNDLENFFWPLVEYSKGRILIDHTIPLWNTLFLSGTPLVSDPQAPIFYLPNLIFLIMPISWAFITSMIAHVFLGSAGIYAISKKVFKWKEYTSVFCALCYIFAPRLGSYLEAGHFGLIISWGWTPWAIFAIWKLTKNPKGIWAVLASISLTSIFLSHGITLGLLLVLLGLIFLFELLKSTQKVFILKYAFLVGILTLGLSAIALLPQIDWLESTTRSLVTIDRDVYPKWISKKEVLGAVFAPWITSNTLDTEKWISLGFILPTLSLLGFLKIKNRKVQISLGILLTSLFLFSLNNISPFYSLFLTMDWYSYLRVTTRVWFIVVLLLIFLAGYGVERFSKRNFLKISITLFTILELAILSWIKISAPITQINPLPEQIYTEIKVGEPSRVFCLNRCIPQKEAAENKLELVDGYNTIQQKNYYQQAWQFTNSFWDYYTLSIPPVGLYTFDKINPDPRSLGEYNTKFIISPYELNNKNLLIKDKIEKYYVYQNLLFLPRVYSLDSNSIPENNTVDITSYTPNQVVVRTKTDSPYLVLSYPYNKNWKAEYENIKINLEERPNHTMVIKNPGANKQIIFNYHPESFKIGSIISLTTWLILGVFLLSQKMLFRNTK